MPGTPYKCQIKRGKQTPTCLVHFGQQDLRYGVIMDGVQMSIYLYGAITSLGHVPPRTRTIDRRSPTHIHILEPHVTLLGPLKVFCSLQSLNNTSRMLWSLTWHSTAVQKDSNTLWTAFTPYFWFLRGPSNDNWGCCTTRKGLGGGSTQGICPPWTKVGLSLQWVRIVKEVDGKSRLSFLITKLVDLVSLVLCYSPFQCFKGMQFFSLI